MGKKEIKTNMLFVEMPTRYGSLLAPVKFSENKQELLNHIKDMPFANFYIMEVIKCPKES
jgi:hypothetical protein